VLNIIIKFIFIFFISILFLSCPISVKNTDDLESFIVDCEKQLDKKIGKSIPGAVVVIIENGEIYYKKTFGYKDKKAKEPMSLETIFQVGSISKTAFALTVMKLVQEGLIDLDIPIDSYLNRWHLPDSKYNKDGVTARRILSHTAGLSTPGYWGYNPKKQLPTLEQSLSSFIYSVKMKKNPGEKWKYSGGGYTVLQLAVEEILGQSLSEYTEANIFGKMGMTNSSYIYNPDMKNKLSKPYNFFGIQIPNYLYTEASAAGLYTTAPDLAKMIIEMINCYYNMENNLVINKEILELMMVPEAAIDKKEYMGMGVFINDVGNGIKTYGHGGDNRGWKAQFGFCPDKKSGIVILTNGNLAKRVITTPLITSWREYIGKK